MRFFAVLLALVWGASAFGDAHTDQLARSAYVDGKAAYERGDYTIAYQKFKESFQFSHEPALLYNIASALQGLRRPHEAAEALRSYMKLVPADPDRPQIESRIAALEEEQHMLDLELQKTKPAVAPPAPPRAVEIRDQASEERKHRRKVLAISLTVGGIVLVGGAVALGLALGLRHTARCTADITCQAGTN
jgi:tetratricopeptide (TPR) repeat protein